jgi:hypothetical protein
MSTKSNYKNICQVAMSFNPAQTARFISIKLGKAGLNLYFVGPF